MPFPDGESPDTGIAWLWALNPRATASYCLGVSALTPFLGAILGLAAVVLGVTGLIHAHRHPEAKGRLQACAGILFGALFGLPNVALSLSVLGIVALGIILEPL